MENQPVTLLNTGLPLALLGAAGVAVPRLLLPRETRSHRVLLAVLAASAVILVLLGMAILAVALAVEGADVAGAFVAAPGATLLFLARSSALGVLVWGPLLLIAGLSLATRIEARRGEDIMRRGR
jgi:hypothetical protein